MNTPITDIEKVLLGGDLSVLKAEQKIKYMTTVCEKLGLNPMTKPFEFMRLNGKEVMYATKGAAEQLRDVHNISIRVVARDKIEGVYVVTAEASRPDGRVDSSTGAVSIEGLKGEALSNALMKAETKAKRRVTLSICSLNMLDETEVESIPASAKGANKIVADQPGPNDGKHNQNQNMFTFGGLKNHTWGTGKATPEAMIDFMDNYEDPNNHFWGKKAQRRPEHYEEIERAKFWLETVAQMEPPETENDFPNEGDAAL